MTGDGHLPRDRRPEASPPDDDAALLALFQDAWQGIEPPPPAPPLAHTDELTRAGIAWTRAAWARLEAPPARIPLPLRLRTARATPLRRVAAAAALLLAVLLGRGLRPDLAHDAAPVSPVGPTAAAAHPDPAPRVVAVADDHIELRSGNVRLVLVTDSPGDAP